MFDIGWSELLIIGVVAVVVIGPKDLPKVMRAIGVFAGKARGLAREFQGQWEEVMRQSELEEMKKQVEKIATEPEREVKKALEPFANLDGSIDISGSPETALPTTPAAPAPTPTVAEAAPSPETPAKPATPA